MKIWRLGVPIPSRTKIMYCLLLSFVFEAFGVSFLASASAGIVDVANTKFGKKVCTYLDSKKVGNQGSTECQIVVDEETGNIHGDLVITAHHVWTKVWNPATLKKVDVGVTATLSGFFVYDVQRREVLDSQLRFEFGTLNAILGKSLNVGTITLSVQTFIDLIEGNLDITELYRLIPNPAPQVFRVEHRNAYDAVKQSYANKYGAENIYFSSREFVGWANPVERGFDWGGQLLVTGGAAAGTIMNQVVSELQKESNSILSWLSRRGEQHAENLLVTLLSGGRFTWPYLAAVWKPVKYEVRHLLFGRPVDNWIGVNHAGFVLIWDWGKVKGVDSLIAQKGKEIYTDLTTEIFQQVYGRSPTADELTKSVAGFTKNGNTYADQIYADATKQIYQEIYGPGVLPTAAELAQARADFANGLSYAEVRAKVEETRLAMLRKERAIQFLLTHYMMNRHEQQP